MSCVKLGVRHFGKEQMLGFGIFARVDLKRGEFIYELTGLLAADDEADRTELSVIQTKADDPKTLGYSRVLFGPLRFINHQCTTPNAEV